MKLTVIREVLLLELMLFNLKSVVKECLCLLSSHGNVHCNLLVSFNRESSNGVLGLRLDWLLKGQILEHLGSLGELISTLTSTEIENQLLNLNLSHLVVVLFLLLLTFHIFSSLL